MTFKHAIRIAKQTAEGRAPPMRGNEAAAYGKLCLAALYSLADGISAEEMAAYEATADFTEPEQNILRAMARNSLNITKCATELHYHRNTLEYHIAKIKKKHGHDPKTFGGLCELLDLLESGDPHEA